ncbi:hypothetical protein [Burkholderia sp. BCC1998]|uniref:hypothetical protein n=1 Tax=Burkholderia sp. BCC1998 TaxID=2817447 RepID=UPI002AB7965D|nr:hypothetical protein [Burkholderia sp. BCC1998]
MEAPRSSGSGDEAKSSFHTNDGAVARVCATRAMRRGARGVTGRACTHDRQRIASAVLRLNLRIAMQRETRHAASTRPCTPATHRKGARMPVRRAGLNRDFPERSAGKARVFLVAKPTSAIGTACA